MTLLIVPVIAVGVSCATKTSVKPHARSIAPSRETSVERRRPPPLASEPEPTIQALDVLLRATVVSSTHVGYAARPSKEARAFAVLYQSSDAEEHIQKLLTEGTPAGQLYGLSWLDHVDQSRFTAVLPDYRRITKTVGRIEGCFVSEEPFSDVLSDIESGEYPRHLRSFAERWNSSAH